MDKKIINELLKYLKMDGAGNFVAGKENIVIPAYVPGNFISSYESIKGSVYGIGSEIRNDLVQNGMKARNVYESWIIVGRDIYHSEMEIEKVLDLSEAVVIGSVYQNNLKADEILESMDISGNLEQKNAQINKLTMMNGAKIDGTYILDGAKIEEFEGYVIVQDYSIKGADIPENMIEALEYGKKIYPTHLLMGGFESNRHKRKRIFLSMINKI